MTKKVGPNEPCPCGSGKKHKKCCGAVGAEALAAGASYDRVDRDNAMRIVRARVEDELVYWGAEEDEDDEGSDVEGARTIPSLAELYWGEYAGSPSLATLPPAIWSSAEGAFEAWAAFDLRPKNGERIVEQILRERELRSGERAFLEAMRQSAMRPYEAMEMKAGESLTLRDLLEGTTTSVKIPMADAALPQGEFLMARVVPCGISGRPEMEGGVFWFPDMFRETLLEKIASHRQLHQLARPGESALDADKELTPFWNQLWMKVLLAGLEHSSAG